MDMSRYRERDGGRPWWWMPLLYGFRFIFSVYCVHNAWLFVAVEKFGAPPVGLDGCFWLTMALGAGGWWLR